jgi:hypothetical protein
MSRAGPRVDRHGYPTRKSSDFASQWRRGVPGSVVANHVGERDSRRPPMAGMHRSVPKLRGFQQRKPRKRVGGQRCDPHCFKEPWNDSFVMAPARNDLHATVAESRRPHVESILTSEVSPDPPPTGCFPTGDSATDPPRSESNGSDSRSAWAMMVQRWHAVTPPRSRHSVRQVTQLLVHATAQSRQFPCRGCAPGMPECLPLTGQGWNAGITCRKAPCSLFCLRGGDDVNSFRTVL